MEASIFAYIKRYSWRQQLLILGLTLLSFPPLYYSLTLPKIIINKALSEPQGQHVILGYELTQVGYLYVLCGMFLALVLIGGGIKYVLNVYAGIVAERMLRRLRYQLYEQVLRFPLPHFRRVSQGELVQMINAETEALGGFVGDALAVPAFQGGTLITILFFMFMQDPILGFAAIALYPLQAYFIPKLQRQVNDLGKRRVRQVRRNAERISETASGVRDIRGNDTIAYELSKFSGQLGEVFWIRFDIYRKKFLIKFLNNFLAQLGPFFFFSIGGYLVITGDITLGALVAVVGAHKDLSSPWKELLTYYQTMYDVKIKYDQTVSQFAPPGMKDRELLWAELPQNEQPDTLHGLVKVTNVTVNDDAGEPLLEAINLEFKLPTKIAIAGPPGAGKEELTLVLSGHLDPNSGRVTLDDRDLHRLPMSVIGRRLAFVGNPTFVFGGTIEENILYGLTHRPVGDPIVPEGQHTLLERDLNEAKRSGNSPYDIRAPWVNYEAAGIADPADRLPTLVRALRTAAFADDVYAMGLRSTVPEAEETGLAEQLLEARRTMRDRLLEDDRLARLVEQFDPDLYNTNATLAENLLFGTPIGAVFDMEHLARHPYVLQVLEEEGLLEELRAVGFKVAQTMVELFTDLPPDHEYFRQFSFIEPDDLPDYRNLIARTDVDHLDTLTEADRERLLALPFKLIVARHRLGLVEDDLQERILKARHRFREKLPSHLYGAIAFFEPEHYNVAATVQDNILFGKVAYGQANAGQKIGELVTEIVTELGLRDRITEAGLATPCGIGGGRLSPPQRQKLAIARAILKRPDILVLYDAVTPLESAEQIAVRDAILSEFEGRTVIWAITQSEWANAFDHVIVLDKGRVAAEGSPRELFGGEEAALPQEVPAS